MQLMLKLVVVAFLASASADGPTPLDKVTELLEALKDDVKTEGDDAEKEYKKVGCKCKEETEAKSSTIKLQNKKIDKSVGEVEMHTTTLKSKNGQLAEYMQHQADKTKEKKEKKEECDTQIAEKKEHLRQRGIMLANIDKAEQLLSSHASSLIQQKETMKVVRGLLAANGKNPMDYEEHSGGIHDVLDKLATDVRSSKSNEEAELTKQEGNCKATDENLQKDLDDTKTNIQTTETDIADEKSKLADAEGNLADARDLLRESTDFLKEVTAHCENKAREHSQHEMLRAAEETAMGDALELLKGDAKANEGKRASLLAVKAKASPVPAKKNASKAVSFLQQVQVHQHGVDQVVALLQQRGQKIQSNLLSSLAHQLKLSTDPFKKVKGLVRELIDRLLEEARNEGSKKGWCDNELSKAEKSRDSSFSSVMDLSALYGTLHQKEKQLTDLVNSLEGDTGAISLEQVNLDDETKARKDEKKHNEKDIEDGEKGLKALQQAQDDQSRTKTKMDETLADLKTSQDLVDGAIKELNELQPTCVNTGMSMAERVQKREAEIQALKDAMEALTSR